MRNSDFRIITPNFELVRLKLTASTLRSIVSRPNDIMSECRMIRTPNSKGFTLIETIITLVVLSIAAVGVLSVFTTGIKGSADPLILSQAISLAQEKMDIIIGDRQNPARGYAWIAAADYNTNPLKYMPENPVPGFANFNRSVTIFCVDAGTLNTNNGQPFPCISSGYVRITVAVANALIGNVALDTLVTNY